MKGEPKILDGFSLVPIQFVDFAQGNHGLDAPLFRFGKLFSGRLSAEQSRAEGMNVPRCSQFGGFQAGLSRIVSTDQDVGTCHCSNAKDKRDRDSEHE